MVMLKTNLDMSVQIMDNIKYSYDFFFIDGHYKEINGFKMFSPQN